MAEGDGCKAPGKALLEVERRFEPGTDRTFTYTGAPPQTHRSRKTGLPEPVYRAPDGGEVSQVFSLDDVGYAALLRERLAGHGDLRHLKDTVPSTGDRYRCPRRGGTRAEASLPVRGQPERETANKSAPFY